VHYNEEATHFLLISHKNGVSLEFSHLFFFGQVAPMAIHYLFELHLTGASTKHPFGNVTLA